MVGTRPQSEIHHFLLSELVAVLIGEDIMLLQVSILALLLLAGGDPRVSPREDPPIDPTVLLALIEARARKEEDEVLGARVPVFVTSTLRPGSALLATGVSIVMSRPPVL